MSYKFTPLRNFYDNDLRSCYQVGLNYTVSDQEGLDDDMQPIVIEAADTLLARKVAEWLAAGKVRLGMADGGDAPAARVRGTGIVT